MDPTMRDSVPSGCRRYRNQIYVPALLAALLVSLAAATAAWGQDANAIYQQELRVQMDQQQPQSRERSIDGGGWLALSTANYNTASDHRWRTLMQYQIRPWALGNYQNVHQVYVRGLLNWDDWRHGSDLGDQDDFDAVVERLWYQFDSAAIHKNATGKLPDSSVRVRVGRDFADIGTDLTLAVPLDMVQVAATIPNWQFMALGGRTTRLSGNLDTSSFVSNEDDRDVWGGQITFLGLQHHKPFVYYLNTSQDRDTERDGSNVPAQRYDYSAQYVGAGSTGAIILPDLRYQTELVGQWGKTYGNDDIRGRDNISAWAYDALLQYLFQVPMHPQVMAEYMFASGDSDRESSATGTAGGNQPGTTDRAFNSLGFRDTGIAFAPQLSNLHIWTAGASFFPFERIDLLSRMEFGTKIFFYQRAADGPISDSSADEFSSRYLGEEWDLFMNWRLTSDLSWTIRYGLFDPASAFEDDHQCRQMIFTGMVFSF